MASYMNFGCGNELIREVMMRVTEGDENLQPAKPEDNSNTLTGNFLTDQCNNNALSGYFLTDHCDNNTLIDQWGRNDNQNINFDFTSDAFRTQEALNPNPWRIVENVPTANEAMHQQQSAASPQHSISEFSRYSRKVFIGGLPPNIRADVICEFFSFFGPNKVDWPHRSCDRSEYPPNGYVFVIYENSSSVDLLIDCCTIEEDGKMSIVLKHAENDKKVQVRPWSISDQVFKIERNSTLYSIRNAVFVGGVPRTLTARELGAILQQAIGDVAIVSLEVDRDTQYPKGAAQVIFRNRDSYVKAIAMRVIAVANMEQEKEMELKPYLFNDMDCDLCKRIKTHHFCANLCCLYYLCPNCWMNMHRHRGFINHKPLTKSKPGNPPQNLTATSYRIFYPTIENFRHNSGRRLNGRLQACHCRAHEVHPRHLTGEKICSGQCIAPEPNPTDN